MTLLEVDLPDDYGFDVPNGAKAARRVPCSACGLSKRHLFDKAALDGGYDVVATGHNLDDEAAVLFGNVLRWNTDYLGRQRPVLAARPGFPKKVKPLVRLGEREMAAYCVLRGIDYQVEECPMADGNRHLGYKEALNAIEVQSPGSKHAFYFGFLDKVASAARRGGRAREGRPRALRTLWCACGRRDLQLLPVGRAGRKGPVVRGALSAGERVLLIDPRGRRYLVILKVGSEFHSHGGYIPHDELIGRVEGTTVRATKGLAYTVLRPTLADFVLKMPRGAQVIYPKDLGPILMLADIYPGRPCARVGGRLRRPVDGLLRAGADIVGYELREDFAEKAHQNVVAFLGEEVLARYRVEMRDCYEGIDEAGLDRIVLDLPEPWQVVKHAERALRPGGILVAYTPTIVQAAQLREALDGATVRAWPRRSRCCTAAGTSRGSRCGPTTGWSRTPGSSPSPRLVVS